MDRGSLFFSPALKIWLEMFPCFYIRLSHPNTKLESYFHCSLHATLLTFGRLTFSGFLQKAALEPDKLYMNPMLFTSASLPTWWHVTNAYTQCLFDAVFFYLSLPTIKCVRKDLSAFTRYYCPWRVYSMWPGCSFWKPSIVKLCHLFISPLWIILKENCNLEICWRFWSASTGVSFEIIHTHPKYQSRINHCMQFFKIPWFYVL